MQKRNLARLLSYTKKYKVYLIIALFSSVISVISSLLVPVFVGKAVDNIIDKLKVDFKNVIMYMVIILIITAINSLFTWLSTSCTNTVSFKTVKDIRIDVFNKINRLPLKYIDKNSYGDMMARVVTDIEQISDGLIQGFTQFFTGIITIFATLGFMLYVNYKVALVVVLLTPLSLFVASFIGKRTYKYFAKQSKTRGEMGAYIEEMISNQKIVKSFSYEDKAQEEFEKINDRLYDCGIKAQFYSALTNPCTRFANSVVYVVVAVLGSIMAVMGSISVGQLSMFLSYAKQYTKPFNEITGVVTELQNAFASAGRVFDILDEEELKDLDLPDMKEAKGNIKVENVCFSYSKEKELIKDLNIDVKQGQKIAIVGETGCGKTTLINLLMKFYQVDEGEILIDGTNINLVNGDSVRNNFGMVLQDTWLFNGTIRENIAYGKDDATDEEIVEAAKMAYAHSFIKRLDKGYDTVISQTGENISSGQKQLLCIARIMLKKPPMLILDEATSSIDTNTEIKIQKAFDKVMEGRTAFIVAHRLSTIKGADLILVMDKGNIVEKGKHQELLDKQGFYYNIYNSQFETVNN